VVRVYDFNNESCYVVRRGDGTPLTVPAWMTHPEAAYSKIVPAARLPVRVLLELHRVTVTCFSANVHNVHEEQRDAKAPSKTPARTLRRNARPSGSTIPAGITGATPPEPGAMDAGVGQEDPEGGQQ